MQELVTSDLEAAISRLRPSPSAAARLRRLADRPSESTSHFPSRRLASVLCLLLVDEHGELQVLLTTRALTLRTSPGETALPGGRVEETDKDVQATARREAWEEVGLALDTPLVHLTTLTAFLSYTLLYVVPVVCLLDVRESHHVLSGLKPNPTEVSAIFTAQLDRFLGFDAPQNLAYSHSFEDVDWLANAPFRLHAFADSSFASDVTGLTADILLSVALLAEGHDAAPAFDRHAPGQLPWRDLVQHVLEGREAKPRKNVKSSS